MPEFRYIVDTFFIQSFLLFFFVHIFFVKKMRGANLIFFIVALILAEFAMVLALWNPFKLEQLEIVPILVITIGTAVGFLYAAYKFKMEKTADKEEILHAPDSSCDNGTVPISITPEVATPESTEVASDEEQLSKDGATLQPSDKEKFDYLGSKSATEKTFITKYVRKDLRDRPIIETFTLYFETYRTRKDKTTFILWTFYVARANLKWLKEEPKRADFIKVWGETDYLGNGSAYSQAKDSLKSKTPSVDTIKDIMEKLKICLDETEKKMGIEREPQQ